ncbi:MAG: hypothetical protein IH845_03070 [Nanoarchaeota archaeon]|nr:hypothetical protein [Nanoarchaeota archaeon]
MKNKYIDIYIPKGVQEKRDRINYLQNRKQEWLRAFEFGLVMIILLSGILIGVASDGSGLSNEKYNIIFNSSLNKLSEINNTLIPILETGVVYPERVPNIKGIISYLKELLYLIILIFILIIYVVWTSNKIRLYDLEINKLYLKLPGVKRK